MDGAWTCDHCGADAPQDAQRCRECGKWLAAYDESEDGATRVHRRPHKGYVRQETPPPETRPDEPVPPQPPRRPPERPREREQPPPPPYPPPIEPRPSGPGHVEGVARNVQVRTETRGSSGNTSTTVVCNFRVEVYDREGRAVRLVPVEMSGSSFRGAVTEGDRVRAEGKVKRGTLRVDRLYNLTTGAEVTTGSPHWALIALVVLLFVVWVLILIFVL
ncbi:hypothetical protein ACH4E8_20130 [Streptomyces sp. NPDC017979]|uniref:hypothetical protein n=1 Tax=Streptomyces sp. NPDC017979 TaxID=3365024 RepID=UPI0037A2B672